MPRKLYQIMNTGIGFGFFGLGVVGVFVPGLPTTPFLILASYFFLRGSRRVDKWFKGTKIYQKYLQAYIETKSMYMKTKIRILIMATTMMTISFIITPYIWVRVIMVVAAVILYYYFLVKMKTRLRESA
ncbi:MAG: YbaN family protein [Lachnospiraceae bacterium]|nr:YbaN family protein [Lachnospiraceae bacterium]